MTDIELYFAKYLTQPISMISNDNLSGDIAYYQSYRALDRRYLEFLADSSNDPGAAEELGEQLFFAEHDAEKAAAYLEKADALGHPEAAVLLAQINREHDLPAYFRWLTRSAELGSCTGLFNLSCTYYKGADAYGGEGFAQDKARALALAEDCIARTKALLGCFLTHKHTNDCREIVMHHIRLLIQVTCTAAEQYMHGDGVPKDREAARALLTDAQAFFAAHIGQESPDFTALLNELEGES